MTQNETFMDMMKMQELGGAGAFSRELAWRSTKSRGLALLARNEV